MRLKNKVLFMLFFMIMSGSFLFMKNTNVFAASSTYDWNCEVYENGKFLAGYKSFGLAWKYAVGWAYEGHDVTLKTCHNVKLTELYCDNEHDKSWKELGFNNIGSDRYAFSNGPYISNASGSLTLDLNGSVIESDRKAGFAIYNTNFNIIDTIPNNPNTVNEVKFKGGVFYNTNIYISGDKKKFSMKGGTIYNCYTTSKGGGICYYSGNYNDNGKAPDCNIELDGVTFESNKANQDGGAIYASECDMKIKNCVFRNNNAPNWGGAIHLNRGTQIIENCEFSGNETFSTTSGYSGGGAIYKDGSKNNTLTLKNVKIHDNKTRQLGGGIYAGSDIHLKLWNVEITNNLGPNGGGGILALKKGHHYYKGKLIIKGNKKTKTGGGEAASDVAFREEYRYASQQASTVISNCGLTKDSEIYLDMGSCYDYRIYNVTDYLKTFRVFKSDDDLGKEEYEVSQNLQTGMYSASIFSGVGGRILVMTVTLGVGILMVMIILKRKMNKQS